MKTLRSWCSGACHIIVLWLLCFNVISSLIDESSMKICLYIIEHSKMLSTASHDATTTAGCRADNQSSKQFTGPPHVTQAEADQDVGLDVVV